MPREFKEGSLLLDANVGTPLIGTIAIGDGYFCDPGQDFSEWTVATGVRTNLVRVVDATGDIAWGQIGDDAIGIPFDGYNEAAAAFAVGNGITGPGGETATIAAVYNYGADPNQEGVLIVTAVVGSWDNNDAITDAVSGAAAVVNTSNSITALTINACEVWSQRRGGTMDWANMDATFSWDPTVAALSYEVRGREYLTYCVTGLEIGTTLANRARLSRLKIPPPDAWEYVPYSRVEVRGNGETLGLGSGTVVWAWAGMTQSQVDRLLFPFPGDTDSSAVAYIWSYIDTNEKRTLVSFRVVMHRPVDGAGKAMLRRSVRPNYLNVVLRFSHAVEAH